MLELLFIIAGIIGLIVGVAQSLTWLVIVAIILLAIGGVWVIFLGDDFDLF